METVSPIVRLAIGAHVQEEVVGVRLESDVARSLLRSQAHFVVLVGQVLLALVVERLDHTLKKEGNLIF